MTQVKISNIVMSDAPQFEMHPGMLVQADKVPIHNEDGTWTLQAGITYNFLTFFNGLSVLKYRRYTCAKDFYLHISLQGGACEFFQTAAQKYDYTQRVLENTKQTIAASTAPQEFEWKLQLTDQDVIAGFSLTPQADVTLVSGYYAAEVAAQDIQTVNLALCTTTFKKEAYVLNNIDIVRTQVLNDPNMAEHFQLHVVDNGRTLDAQELSHDGVTVHPNPNVGGSGGFSRGMIEALEQTPKATHVLLMDDDVIMVAESFKRTFYLLRILNEKYKNAFISGAMMHLDEPALFFEDVGYIDKTGYLRSMKGYFQMDRLHSVVELETFPTPMPYKGIEDSQHEYAGWWYCVIPITAIEKHGLSLPLFVRTDDVEYSRRVKPKIMTLNGICVWHEPFNMRYSAAQERYQMIRNQQIVQHTSDVGGSADFTGDLKRQFYLELRKFNYTNAQLMIEAMQDYLKGPSYIAEPGKVEQRFMDANKNSEKLTPLEDMREDALAIGVDIDEINPRFLFHEPKTSPVQKALQKLTDNGQRFFSLKPNEKDGIAVIDVFHAKYPRYRIHGAQTIFAIDPFNAKGVIRTKDKKRYRQLSKQFKHLMREMKREDERLKKEYKDALPVLTSVKFWKEYLGIE